MYVRWLTLPIAFAVTIGQGIYPQHQERKELRVFAGAVNLLPLTKAANIYEKSYNVKVWLTYGGSGVVLSQIKLARKGDVYIPGSDDYMMKAINEKIVNPKSVRTICWLIPVINVPKGNPKAIKSLNDLTKRQIRVGIAAPGSVCLGDVAKEILQGAGLWESVKKNIVLQAKDCADLAMQIKLNTVDAIIGWDVFRVWYPDTPMDTLPIPSKLIKARSIVGAVTVFAQDKKEAQRFVDFLASGKGKQCYLSYGYSSKRPSKNDNGDPYIIPTTTKNTKGEVP